MGFNISWVGFDGIGKAAALARLGLIDTGEPDEAKEAAFSGAEIPGNWFILSANDFDFVSHHRLVELSTGCRVIACQVHEGIMFSASYCYEDGRRVWGLEHNAQKSPDDLWVFGSPPPSWVRVRERAFRQQDEDAGHVDYIFDIPLDVTADLCPYRHNRLRFDWGQPRFTSLIQDQRRLYN